MKFGQACLLGSLILTVWSSLATAEAQTPSLRWTHGGTGNEFWVAKHVALADNGTQVFTELGTNAPTRLLSAFDQNPPVPIWDSASAQTAIPRAVDAAERDDTYAALVKIGSSMVLRRYSSSSCTPMWTYTFPVSVSGNESVAVRITPDGQKIVAGVFDLAAFRLKVAVFNAGSGSPTALHTLDSRGSFRAFEIDDQARTLYVASTMIRLFDLGNGSLVLHQNPLTTIFDGHAFSSDGSRFAFGTYGQVRVYRRSGTTYVPDFTHEHAGSNVCNRIAFSNNGTTMACAFDYYDTGMRVDIDVVDLATRAVTLSDSVTGVSALGYQNRIADLAISRDGRRIVAGVWGDETGAAPELLIYDNGHNTPVGTVDLPGSPFDLDLSADGKRLAVASKLAHRLGFSSHGRVDLYELDALDFDLRGPPRAGSTVTFEVSGGSFEPAFLLSSSVAASRPVFHIQLGGVLFLKRRFTQVRSLGVTDGLGRRSTTYAISGGTGSELYFQGLTSSLTEDWAKVTILP